MSVGARASRAMFRTLLASSVLWLSGCITREGEPPAHFPAPLYDSGCPVISGSYRLQLDAGSQGSLSEAWFGPQTATSVSLSIDDDPDEQQWRMTWYRDPVIYEAEITALRKAEPKRFQQWIREARLMLEPLSSRYQSDREQAMRALANLGPTPELRLHGHKWSCEDGWYVDWQGDKAVRMTADVADGLLIQLDTETRSELGIWCGDGCKGIPYYLDVQSRWLRLSPVPKPAAWYPPEVPFAVEDVGVTHYDDRDVRVTALRERLLAALSDQMQLISLEEWPDHIALSIFIDGMASLPDMTDWLRDQPEIESVTQSSRMQMSGNRVRIVLEIRFKR